MNSNNNQIEEIKNKLDIVQVVEKYVKLRPAGKNYQGLCPFHSEKTPSFIVSPDIQRYKCFGCGETGDIFNFLQKVENLDFPEALEKLAQQAGVELQKKKVDYKYKVLEEINYNATRYYFNELKKSDIAKQYLFSRGFTDDSIKSFGIGFAPKYPKLKEYLLKTQKYKNQELIDSGLFSLKEGVIKEKFYERIMFPIRSRKGIVLAFTGRVLPTNTWGPKYMNSPDTPIFHKKDNVFGQYESRQEIRKEDLVIMCEGSTDVISAHQHGIRNIVAPLGTALTEEQLLNLSSLTKNFLFLFDSDEAGQKALVRAFKMASELKLNPYAASPKPFKDIDELLQKDSGSMKDLIKNKKEAFSFILKTFLEDKNINDLEDFNKIRAFIGSLVDSVKDETTRNLYLRKVYRATKITISTDSQENREPSVLSRKGLSVHVKLADNKLEKKYLQLLLLPRVIEKESLVDECYLTDKSLQKIYKILTKLKNSPKEKIYKHIKSEPDIEPVFEDLIFDLSGIPQNEEEAKKEMSTIKTRLEMIFYKNKLRDLGVKLALAEENGDETASQKYLEEILRVNNILKQVSHG